MTKPKPKPAPAETYTLGQLLHALVEVESGLPYGDPRAANVSGDNGAALGPLQIHNIYVQDAWGMRIFNDLSDANTMDAKRADYLRSDLKAAEKTFLLYMHRYHPYHLLSARLGLEACETLARSHNGGPNGATKDATKPYWDKVLAALRKGA